MILLASTSDKVQIVTSAAVAIDVHAVYVDFATPSTITPGRKNTAISTATTTDVVASPAGSTVRKVKYLNVRNKGSSPQVTTVQHTDGTTTVELKKVNLLPGRCLTYMEGDGWELMDQPLKLSQNQLTASAVTQYTVPSDMVTEVTSIWISNDDTSERTITLHFVASGGSAGVTNKFLDAVPVGPGQTLQIECKGTYLNSGDFISALASVASQVNLHISGQEHA